MPSLIGTNVQRTIGVEQLMALEHSVPEEEVLNDYHLLGPHSCAKDYFVPYGHFLLVDGDILQIGCLDKHSSVIPTNAEPLSH